MAIQHADITDPDIHEPKGVESATLGKIYIADGAGSGDWIDPLPRGSVAFSNISTPLTVTYPAAYTKVAPTTTVSGYPREVTEATTGRVTYTGTLSKPVEVKARLVLSQSIGSNRDIRIAIYKNGSIITISEGIVSTVTATKVCIETSANILAATNDYFEIYVRNEGASGDLSIYNYSLALIGLGIQ